MASFRYSERLPGVLHEGSKVLQEAFIYFLCSGFCKKDMLFTLFFFFMDVNANFVGELLGNSNCLTGLLRTFWITDKINASLTAIINYAFFAAPIQPCISHVPLYQEWTDLFYEAIIL